MLAITLAASCGGSGTGTGMHANGGAGGTSQTGTAGAAALGAFEQPARLKHAAKSGKLSCAMEFI